MAKSKPTTKPQNLPAVGQKYIVPSDSSIIVFNGCDKANMLQFEYIQSTTKKNALYLTEQDLSDKLKRGIFVKL